MLNKVHNLKFIGVLGVSGGIPLMYLVKEYRACKICPRECGVNRLHDEKGWCGIGRDSKVFNTTVLVNENEEITPTYAIYLCGCNLHCRFCSVAEENIQARMHLPRPMKTPNSKQTNFTLNRKEVNPEFMDVNEGFVERVRKEIEEARPKSVSFIGGEPSVHLFTIIELIDKLKPELPLAFYSNMYFQPRIRRIISEVFEYIVADLHFGNNRCAQMLTDIETTQINADFFETTTANIKAMKKKIILRHLLLPGHIECCFKRIVDWISMEMPDKTLYLLTNYFPYIKTRDCRDGYGLNRQVSQDEITKALDYAKNKGIIIKTLDLLKPRMEMKEAKTQNQEIVIEEDGRVAFKYLDGVALEIAHTLTYCLSEWKDEIASPLARNDKSKRFQRNI